MSRLATMWKEIWAEQWQWRKKRICGVYGVTGKKKDKQNKKQGVRVNRDRDKIGKETKSRVGERRVLEVQSREKGLYLREQHPVLGPLLRLLRGRTPKGSKTRISRKRDPGASFLVQAVGANTNSKIALSGRACKHCLLRTKSRETERPVLIAHMVWQPGTKTMLGRRRKKWKIKKKGTI